MSQEFPDDFSPIALPLQGSERLLANKGTTTVADIASFTGRPNTWSQYNATQNVNIANNRVINVGNPENGGDAVNLDSMTSYVTEQINNIEVGGAAPKYWVLSGAIISPDSYNVSDSMILTSPLLKETVSKDEVSGLEVREYELGIGVRVTSAADPTPSILAVMIPDAALPQEFKDAIFPELPGTATASSAVSGGFGMYPTTAMVMYGGQDTSPSSPMPNGHAFMFMVDGLGENTLSMCTATIRTFSVGGSVPPPIPGPSPDPDPGDS